MRHLLNALTLCTAAVSPLTASASDAGAAPAPAVVQLLAAPARLDIVDAAGVRVGQLVPVADGTYRLRIIGATRTSGRMQTTAGGMQRAASPDTALTPQQMEAQRRAQEQQTFEPFGSFGP